MKEKEVGSEVEPADRVLRGGSWDDPAFLARAASHDGIAPGFRSDYLGLRLVRDESPIQPEHRHRSEHEKEG